MKVKILTVFGVFLTFIQSTVGQGTNTPSLQISSSLNIENRSEEDRVQFLLDVAQAYLGEEDYESAVDAYERILKIDPSHDQARYIIAHAYINTKEYHKAEAGLLALIEENPDDFKLLNNIAWLYATAEDPAIRDGKKAIRLAQEAMIMAPNDHHVWSTLAEARYVSGDYEGAYRAIEHMTKLAVRYGKSISKESVEDYNEQIKKCKRAWDAQRVMNGEEIDD